MSLPRRAALALVVGAIIVGGAAPAMAKVSSKGIRPAIRVSRHDVLQSDPVVVTGRAVGRQVLLYRQIDRGRWVHVQTVTVSHGRYRTTVRPTVGARTRFRAGLTGPATTITSTECDPLPDHAGVQMWANDMKLITTLPTRWTQLICSAAPGSTIRFSAMWIFDDDATMHHMVAALRDVHRLRGVHVQLLVRRASYSTDAIFGAPSWTTFTREFHPFAQIYSCMYSCEDGSANAHMHVKAITISKTIFGQSAAAETGSNFSHKQLADQRESAVYVYGNQQLTNALQANWDAMLEHQPVALPIWDQVGDGIAISFDPQTQADDPVANELSTLTCQPGDTVQVMNATVTRRAVVQQLDRLADSGCVVRVLYETTTPKTDANVVLGQLRLHDKVIVIHAHGADSAAVNEVICGSEDLLPSSLLLSNQQLLRVRLTNIVAAYDAWFARLWSNAASPTPH